MQTLTIKLPLHPTAEQEDLIEAGCKCYINTINMLVAEMVEEKAATKKTSKNIICQLNSSVKCQAVRDAKSVFSKARKSKYKRIPILKKPQIIWNNQNYRLKEDAIELPFIIDGKSKRVALKIEVTERIKRMIDGAKFGSARITKKNNKWVAQISINSETKTLDQGQSMGVDLGILIPAVLKVSSGQIKFVGNGRQNKFQKRKYRARRQKLGKLKKQHAIEKMNNKEQRYMTNQDHQVSRQIIDFAEKHNVKTINLEKLENIRQTTKTSRKNKKNIHTWSFYRLAQFIQYKANLKGIEVVFVDPKYTSQKCPICGKHHKAKGRSYTCNDCGFQMHRDLVAATNILQTTVIDGNGLSA